MDRKSLLVTVVSTVVGLAACEIGMRMLPSSGRWGAWAFPRIAVAAGSASLRKAAAYVARMDAAPGTDRRWFVEDPEPLQRGRVDSAAMARYREFERRGLYPASSQYVFSRAFVAQAGCMPDGAFRGFPDRVLAFDPPGPSGYPRFRFPPGVTMPDGMVTNRFGFRGPQVSLEKPARTIRVAFAGASTTVNTHEFAFSYPEYTVHWLNRFAQANGMDVHFEVLNAGREGIGSEDIAAIVRYELVPLNPDLVVYYEGANQFYVHELIYPPMQGRAALDARDAVSFRRPLEWFRVHSAIGDRIGRLFPGSFAAGEPAKPSYEVRWPNGVDEFRPDPDNPNLPMNLTLIVKDLDIMRDALRQVGGVLAVASFERLAVDGLRLSPAAHRTIYEQLNTAFWPLRYADVRRIANFQNRVFRAYADSRHVPFLDIAGQVPQDPSLFTDTVHMTEVGERLKAWIAFQQLVPFIRRQIESGQLPQTSRPPLPPPPSMAAFEVPVCPGR